MVDGLSALGSLRGAIEVSEAAGTTPTRLLYIPQGAMSIQPTSPSVEDRREWAKGFDTLSNLLPGGPEDWTVTITGVPCSFEDVGWWFCTFFASGSGAPAVVDTNARSRTYTPLQGATSLVVPTAMESLNLEYSTIDMIGTAGWQMDGLVGETLVLHWKKIASGSDTGLTMDITLRSKAKAAKITAFTGGALSTRTQTFALGQNTIAYVDTAYGNLGNTADGDITEADLTISRPATFHEGMVGGNVHTSLHRGEASVELSYLRKFDGAAELEMYTSTTDTRAIRAVRLENLGATVGSVDAKNTIRADIIGKYDTVGQLPEFINGLWYQRYTMKGVYDSGQTSSVRLFTQNNIATQYDAL